MAASLTRNLWTSYKSTGDVCVNYFNTPTVCFGSLVSRLPNSGNIHNHYSINIFKPQDADHYNINGQNANATLLNINEIRNHIRIVKNLFNFSFKVTEKEDRYIAHIDINQPKIYHRYLLSWIRYTYEYPFNIACLDMHEMKKQPECRFISAPNLMLTTLLFTNAPRIDHCICNHGVPKGLTNANLKNRFLETDRLNSFYNRIPQISWVRFPDRMSSSRKTQLKEFERRKEMYLEMYHNYIKP
jgi:hypothetical protein